MTSSLHITQNLRSRIEGTDYRFGEGWEYSNVKSIDGDVIVKKLSLAASGTADLFNGANDGFATCSFFWVATWCNCVLEVTYDTAAAVATTYQTIYVPGAGGEKDKFGQPVWVPNAYAYAGYSANFGGGTLYYPDKIEIKNLDSSNASKVEFFCGE